MTDKLSRGLVETWASDPIDNKVTVQARELLEAWDKIDRLTGELESAEENINSLHVYWKGAEVRAEKAEAKLSEVEKERDGALRIIKAQALIALEGGE